VDRAAQIQTPRVLADGLIAAVQDHHDIPPIIDESLHLAGVRGPAVNIRVNLFLHPPTHVIIHEFDLLVARGVVGRAHRDNLDQPVLGVPLVFTQAVRTRTVRRGFPVTKQVAVLVVTEVLLRIRRRRLDPVVCIDVIGPVGGGRCRALGRFQPVADLVVVVQPSLARDLVLRGWLGIVAPRVPP